MHNVRHQDNGDCVLGPAKNYNNFFGNQYNSCFGLVVFCQIKFLRFFTGKVLRVLFLVEQRLVRCTQCANMMIKIVPFLKEEEKCQTNKFLL